MTCCIFAASRAGSLLSPALTSAIRRIFVCTSVCGWEVAGALISATRSPANLIASACERAISSTIARTSLCRLNGSLKMHRPIVSITGVSMFGLTARGDCGCPSTIARAISVATVALHGSAPVAISYITTPIEKTSVRTSTGWPLICSGDM